MIIRVEDRGLEGYDSCLARQTELFEGLLRAKAIGEECEPTIILCEHPHVYTLGKSGEQANLLINSTFLERIGATYFRTDRGGDITYHGPGQLVGYPILDLELLGIGLREYIWRLEQAVIATVAEYGVEADRIDGAAGVWLEPSLDKPLRKICAIGVRSSRYVTMHGFALNVNTDLSYFSHINPCGFTDRGVTSLAVELGNEIDFEGVKSTFVRKFREIVEN